MVAGSPSNVVADESPSNVVATGSPSHVVAAGSPSNVVAAGSPSSVGANHSISQETQRNYQANISQFKQAIIDFKSSIASNSSITQILIKCFWILFLMLLPNCLKERV